LNEATEKKQPEFLSAQIKALYQINTIEPLKH